MTISRGFDSKKIMRYGNPGYEWTLLFCCWGYVLLNVLFLLSWETSLTCLFISKTCCKQVVNCTGAKKPFYIRYSKIVTLMELKISLSLLISCITPLTLLGSYSYDVHEYFMLHTSWGKFNDVTLLTFEYKHATLYCYDNISLICGCGLLRNGIQ